MMDEFTPRFRHFAALIIAGVLLWAGGEFIAPDGSKMQIFLCILAGICVSFAVFWIWELLAGTRHQRYIDVQEVERANIEAVTRFSNSVCDLPIAEKLQTLGKMFPEYGFDTIQVQPQVIVQENKNGAVTQYEWPHELANDDQWQKFAVDYFEKTHALTFGYYTENGIDNNKIFHRRQFEKILAALVENGLADKDPQSEVTTLRPVGETGLGFYYKPESVSTSSPPGFHVLNLPVH